MNKSIWSDTKINHSYSSLEKDIETDILIIGGGITGVNILYQLKDKDVILVERNRIGMATTLNTTGKLTYLQDILTKIKDKNKFDLYLKSQIYALDEIKKVINNNHIICNLELTKSYLFTNKDNEINKLKKLKEYLENNDIDVNENKLKIVENKYSISVDNTYLFNPIKYIDGLLDNIDKTKIYENTNITLIKKKDNYYICSTGNNKIKCNKVILANHYPYFLKPYFFPLKSSIEKSYIIEYKNNIENTSLINISKPVTSIRTYQNNIIYLSSSDILCNNLNDNDFLNRIIHKVDYVWTNNDIVTDDYIPYIGYIDKNMIIATGYNAWGMLNSFLSGIIIKDLIEEKENEYIKLFNPKRNRNTHILKNTYYSIKGYIKGNMKNDKIKYKKINGKKVMIYENNIVKRRCPHMKCKLLFNEIENTFDCPCHGSRFDKTGKVIKGPSKYDINIE